MVLAVARCWVPGRRYLKTTLGTIMFPTPRKEANWACAVAECTFQYDSSRSKVGNFSSPNFPANYSEDLECFYYFSGEDYETLRLTFFVFELEKPFEKGCLTDYIDISTITILNEKQLVGRYCGRQVPPNMLFMHPRAEIVFKSNLVVHGRGFYGRYEFLDEKFIPPPPSTPQSCGGNETGVGGVIMSPGFPGSFQGDLDCIWLIRAEYSQYIYVRILKLHLYGSIANCAEAQLSIIDGYSSLSFNTQLLQKYCGDLTYYKNAGDQIRLSTRNRILIRFKTAVGNDVSRDKKNDYVGFKLVWTAVNFEKTGRARRRCSQYLVLCGAGSSGGVLPVRVQGEPVLHELPELRGDPALLHRPIPRLQRSAELWHGRHDGRGQ
ncbi:hypothetical protein LAZ67_2005949, partial [Cordylochernes scorpioides]